MRSPRISMFLCRRWENSCRTLSSSLLHSCGWLPSPVIEVPQISLDRSPQRLGDHLRQPQMVEQLVHVPTVVSYSSLQQLTAEQIVDIPVPRSGGLQGSRPGQCSTACSSHVGAAWWRWARGFSHFSPREKVRGKVRTRGRN